MDHGPSCVCVGHKGAYQYDPDCPVCEPPDVPVDHTPESCPACEGPGVPLGVLGRRAHFRCRACGTDFSVRLS
jgi:hypothetical protein